jgi:hypothetical protein
MDDEQDFDQDFEQGMQGGVGEAAYYETENENWFSRLGNALAGVCIGLILFVGAFPVLWWNEGRAVDRYNALDSARDLYVPITSESVDAANEGKLVYITGLVLPTENITDVDFGVETMNKIKLNRNVEIYQWKENKQTEKRKTVGGGTETITKYTYAKTWSTSLIDSTRFHTSGYNNPTFMPYTAQGFYADLIIGEFSFPNDLVERMATYSPLYQNYNVTTLPSNNPLAQNYNELADSTGFYFSTRSPPNPANALIGDTRVSYQTAEGGQVSILAQQSGKTFVPWVDKDTETSIYRLERGTVTPEAMISNAEAENKVLTWILRVVGMGMMSGGIGLVLSPLEVAADIIPCIGDLVGGAITLVSTLIGVIISLVVIGIAWVANRPVLLYSALGGLVVIGGLVYLGVRRKNANQDLAQGHGQGPTTAENFSNNEVIVPVVPGQPEEPDIAYKP